VKPAAAVPAYAGYCAAAVVCPETDPSALGYVLNDDAYWFIDGVWNDEAPVTAVDTADALYTDDDELTVSVLAAYVFT